MTNLIESQISNHPGLEVRSKSNETLSEEVSINNTQYFLFDCETCSHTLKKTLYDVSIDEQWCKFCSKNILCDDVSCGICFNQPLDNSEKLEHLNINNELKPCQVSGCSDEKFLCDCPNCGQVLEKSLESISNERVLWCKYCE